MTGIIRGTGSYVPERILDNNDLAEMLDTSDEWIRERTGIVRRHLVQNDTTVTMAVKAAERALENAKINAEELDLILVSTVSSNVLVPCTACEVQRAIGAKRAACFDLNAACSGFLFALHTAQAYIHGGIAGAVLVIGAESLSDLVDWQDRGTAILFGDGAGAAVLTAGPGTMTPVVMHSEGDRADALRCGNRLGKNPASGVSEGREAASAEDGYLRMNGREVFEFAVRRVPQCIGELLTACGLETEEIDLFFLHQANRRIVESVAKRLHTDLSRFPMNLMEYGNTSSASIPILLDEWNRQGKLKKGMKLVLAGFGAGLSWGAAYVEWAV